MEFLEWSQNAYKYELGDYWIDWLGKEYIATTEVKKS